MADLNVKISKVEILPHPNPKVERLELAQLGGEGGYISIVGKGSFQSDDLVIYIPPDAVLPNPIMESLAKNKITMKSPRLRAIKIQGVLSEGLCLKPSEWLNEREIYEDNDVMEVLGITKYEPPPPRSNIFKSAKGVNNNYENDNFVRYNCVNHFKKYPNTFKENEKVVVTTKFHGSNHRVSFVDKPNYKKSWWHKLKSLIFSEEKKEFLVGSHNKIRFLTKNAIKYDSFKDDLYWRASIKYNLENVVKQIAQGNLRSDGTPHDVAIYSEVIGFGIQTGYNYGIPEGEIEIRVFDIMIGGKFINWDAVKHLCDCFTLPTVDELYSGAWSIDLLELAQSTDEYNGQKYIREGVVIRPAEERKDHKCGRVMMKLINPVYLLDKKNSDNH